MNASETIRMEDQESRTAFGWRLTFGDIDEHRVYGLTNMGGINFDGWSIVFAVLALNFTFEYLQYFGPI